jgi:hypothetical protein
MCDLDRQGTLLLTLGGMSKEFRLYHGVAGEMGSGIIADDFELVRHEPKPLSNVAAWDAGQDVGPALDWSAKTQWIPIENSTHSFVGTPVLQGRHLVGAVRKSDGGLAIYSVQGGGFKQSCGVVPSPALPSGQCKLVRDKDRTGVQVSSAGGDRSYTAWFTDTGLIRIEATLVAKFQVQDCRLRHGLLPSFVGTDLFYSAAKMRGVDFSMPSTQWFVGLGDGSDNMLVAVWESQSQAVSLGVSGEDKSRLIDSLSIDTKENGFWLSFVEHANLWHQETLNEDWLGEYVPVNWEHPFPARWMTHLFVTPGGKPSFRLPNMEYSFPMADAKTRMWGVWFEDWNHYPFFFDNGRTIFHFEKTFIPNGDAVTYFLQPAAADLFSPCEIVEQALGPEKAAALFDLDANQLRKLSYSTPDQFMYDRPVCATTTRLSHIKQQDKATVGVNLATHLYEFIREIRARVDQYAAFFDQTRSYLATARKDHPELADYLGGLEKMVSEAQSKTQEIYATPLPDVQKKIDAMKELLKEGQGDGFDCSSLDVRGTAGAQDDLCRRYNRLVLRLTQTAGLNCGDSREKAIIAKEIWDRSRQVLRRPTRWEPRRTLYFFEP